MALTPRQRILACSFFVTFLVTAVAEAQTANDSTSNENANAGQHEHMNMAMNTGWQFMQDSIVFAEFNHQGSPRGGNELVVPNWWMGMASRDTPRGRLTFT